MFLVKTAFWIAIVIMLIPSDPARQAQIYQTASYAVHHVATFCDRNADVCQGAGAFWGLFKEKAVVGARMLGGLVSERMAGPAPVPGPVSVGDPFARRHEAPVLERLHPAGDTLRPRDRALEWRGSSRAPL
jgi:hypothetical protein